MHPAILTSQSISKNQSQSPSVKTQPTISKVQIKPQPVINSPQQSDKSPVAKKLSDYPQFPIDEFKNIFTYGQGIKLEELIQEMRKNVENNGSSSSSSSAANYIISQFNSPSPEVQSLIHANANAETLFSLIMRCNIISIDFASFCWADKTDSAKLKASGTIGGVLASYIEIKKFIDGFYLSDINNYDYTNLVLKLLTDNNLSAFLQDIQIQNQIINIISALKIPEVKPETSKKLINLVTSLQKIAQKQPINDLSDLSSSLQDGQFFYQIIDLITDIKPLFQLFLESNPYPVEYLLKTIRDVKPQQINANQKLEYFDCKQTFESFKDSSLGVFGPLIISTPLQDKIKNRDLSHFIFSEFPKEKSVNLSFNRYHFDRFSFKEAEFHHMTIKDTCFVQCDFSKAKFFGQTTFINVYMDQKSADSLVQAMTESFQTNEDLTAAGLSEVWILTKGLINEKLTINSALEEYLAKPSTKEPLEEQEEEKPNEGWFNWAPPSFLKTMFQPVENVQKPIPETIKETADEDKSQIDDWETKFKALEKNLEHKIQEYKDQLKSTSPEEVKRLGEHIETHQKAIKEVKLQLEEIQAQKIAKEQIAIEQRQLLEHEYPQIKIYYETILTKIYFFLHSVAQVSNEELNLLKSISGGTTKISNSNKKFLKKQDIRERMAKSLDRFVEKVDFIKPVFRLPILADLADPILTKIVDTNDKSLVDKAKGFINGLTSRKMEKMADEIARKLTYSYEEQLALLTDESARKFAKIAAECIAASLLNGDIGDSRDFVTQAWLSVRLLGANRNAKVPLLQLPIPLTKKTYPGVNGKYYTIQNLYHDSGIAVRDENGWIKCPLKDNEKQEFGYFRIEKEELKYFPSNSNKNDNEPIKIYKLGERNSVQKAHELALNIQESKKELQKIQILVNQLQRKVLIDETKLGEMMKGGAVNDTQVANVKPSPPINHPIQNNQGTSWLTSIAPIPVKTPLGLSNIGNSCYMNASLQMLFNIPQVLNAITSYKQIRGETKKGEVIKCLRDLLLNPFQTNSTEHLNQLENLRTAFFDYSGWGSQGLELQQDAQEFLQCILGLLDLQKVDLGEKAISKVDESKIRVV